MSTTVFMLRPDDYRESTEIPKQHLALELVENLRAHGGYASQEEFDELAATEVEVDREFAGWPWTLAISHPLFGHIGLSEEKDLGRVAALLGYVLNTPDDELTRQGQFLTWPEPWAIPPGTTSISLQADPTTAI